MLVNGDAIPAICVLQSLADVLRICPSIPCYEGVLDELSRKHSIDVILVGNVPSEVLEISLCEFLFFAYPLNFDGEGRNDNLLRNKCGNTFVDLEKFLGCEIIRYKCLPDVCQKLL